MKKWIFLGILLCSYHIAEVSGLYQKDINIRHHSALSKTIRAANQKNKTLIVPHTTEDVFSNWQENKACTKWVDSIYATMDWQERIAQFFMIPAYTAGENYNMEKVATIINNKQAGGVIFFKGNPTNQLLWTNKMQATARIPVMIGIDGEWGLNMRLDSTLQWPKQLTMGALTDDELIYKAGQQIGLECKRMGIHVNFAPDVDINSNANNPVINERSFGEDKYSVAIKGLQYALGMQQVGVLACAKHFPGHGDTDKDSHHTLPTVTKTLAQLKQQELYPFEIAFRNGIASVMVAHLNVPALDSSKSSSTSLSKNVIQGFLKNELHFKGLVFSDALNMKGVSSYYLPGVVDSIAFMAGNDILVFSENSAIGIEKLLAAKNNGAITEAEMEQRVKKVLAYKFLMGLNHYQPANVTNLIDDINPIQNKVLIQHIYNKAITVAANEQNLIPIKNSADGRPALVAIDSKEATIFETNADLFQKSDMYIVPSESDIEYNKIEEKLSAYKNVIIGLHGMSRLGSKNYGINNNTVAFIERLAAKTNITLILFGSPYSLKYFDKVKNIIVAYEDNEYTQKAAANVLYGGLPALGKLPVGAGTKFLAGNGVIIGKADRLQIATPEELGLYPEYFNDLSEIAFEGVLAKAYPGCQVLVAKDNKVIWNKSYGTKIYEESKKALPTQLYDLASVTKIAATTLSVMKLYDEGEITLDTKVGEILTLDDSATIKELTIADLLTHQSGLKPFIEFYKNTIDANYPANYQAAASSLFPTAVADNMYAKAGMRDEMWQQITHTPVSVNKSYVYSDLNFYILQKIVEYISEKPLDVYVATTFYKPMGLSRMTYLPLDKFSKDEIAPTENDKLFRKQIIQGYVHDPGAAMYGGVAGHAGLFSDAFDLAQLMQLLLNKGTYNGIVFFKPGTVDLFTAQYNKRSRRGLGFDKPEGNNDKGSPTADGTPLCVFGHTGFTGNCVWVDPESKLTFIFLSNRVYPNADNPRLVKMNIRGNLQKSIYKSLQKNWVTDN